MRAARCAIRWLPVAVVMPPQRIYDYESGAVYDIHSYAQRYVARHDITLRCQDITMLLPRALIYVDAGADVYYIQARALLLLLCAA